MHRERPRDFGQCALLQKVRRHDETYFGGQPSQRLIGRSRQSWIGRRHALRFWRGKLSSFFGFLVETYKPPLFAIGINELLSEHRAQPPIERTAAAVGNQLRNALAIAQPGAV